MTAEKKAKELVEGFRGLVDDGDRTCSSGYENAKECAIVVVDEILEAVPELEPMETYMDEQVCVDFFINETYTFWKEVKLELEKL